MSTDLPPSDPHIAEKPTTHPRSRVSSAATPLMTWPLIAIIVCCALYAALEASPLGAQANGGGIFVPLITVIKLLFPIGITCFIVGFMLYIKTPTDKK